MQKAPRSEQVDYKTEQLTVVSPTYCLMKYTDEYSRKTACPRYQLGIVREKRRNFDDIRIDFCYCLYII